MTKVAPLSVSFSGHGQHEYECVFDWPVNCFCQAGTDGLVFSERGNYNTAFFEAFPRNPKTFIRGEGTSVAEAEKRAWEQYQRFTSCTGHEFERRGYTNGAGLCKHCGMFGSKVFEPSTLCCICDKLTDWTLDNVGNYYCEEHVREKPLDKWTAMDWHIAFSENDFHGYGFFQGKA